MEQPQSTRPNHRTLGALARSAAEATRRYWLLWRTTPVPDHPGDAEHPDSRSGETPAPAIDPRTQRIRELERVLDLLEQTKVRLSHRGWTRDGWFAVGGTDRTPHPLVGPKSHQSPRSVQDSVQRSFRSAGPACLVGSLLLLAHDPDTAPALPQARRAIDELYEAMHEQAGHTSARPGRSRAASDRLSRVRGLTLWNDAPGRTHAEVDDLLDRAIARVMVAACS